MPSGRILGLALGHKDLDDQERLRTDFLLADSAAHPARFGRQAAAD